MTDRIPLDHLTSDQYDTLRDELDALRAISRGYCPECGRGDAAPTVEDWERERHRAEQAEARAQTLLAVARSNKRHVQTIAPELDRAEDALDRVRRLCELTIAASVRVDAVQQAIDTLAALDGPVQPHPEPTRGLDQ